MAVGKLVNFNDFFSVQKIVGNEVNCSVNMLNYR